MVQQPSAVTTDQPSVPNSQFQFSKEIVEPVLREMAAKVSHSKKIDSTAASLLPVNIPSSSSASLSHEKVTNNSNAPLPQKKKVYKPRQKRDKSSVEAKTTSHSSVASVLSSVIQSTQLQHQPAVTASSSNTEDSSTKSAINKSGQQSHLESQTNSRKKSEPEISIAAKKQLKNQGPFHCSICDKEFMKWPSFRKHKATHLDEKLYHCKLCPSSFNFETNLTLHGMFHEAEVSGCLQCPVCSIKLSRLVSLKSHLRAHEKEENLLCVECGDEFPTKGRLDAHLGKFNNKTG